jgi:hypothetical protein
MNSGCDGGTVAADFEIVGLARKDEPVNGMPFGAGVMSAPVSGQCKLLVLPGSCNGLTIGRQRTADAVGVGNEVCATEGAETLVAKFVAGQSLGDLVKRRRSQDVDFTFAG